MSAAMTAVPSVLGIPVDFILFALTLAGVALFHHHTLRVAVIGLLVITAYKLAFSDFRGVPGVDGLLALLGHEWVTVANLFGLLFTIDRIMRQGSWLDFGMFLQSLMVAARGLGLDTCPQAAFTPFHRIIMPAIGAPAHEQLVCGMSLGYRDPDAIENTLLTEREPVTNFVKFIE